eukprot:CAMPEP_0195019210 /NCGR_PEP_ID=MMETSP0326_2-20130528/32243_1 /TAXON_ID=2866 ORGANISM="Crypthecodinium cohnii, Strain Seligo" /NCGR_SAMPLE_ID=MMETSP0326_2 /ASSEMBLY_ACC=CAM_ASM_000348 /LENGTH=187 /DNA_ID=CAMNT_0040037135 /DNA_START=14 /DNA_END=575 /DNA_ORIENTATION=-
MGRNDSRSRSRSPPRADRDRIQRMVDERQQCRRDRDFSRADELRDQLRNMGVNVDDSGLMWRGPGGMEGDVHNGGQPGIQRKDGDWDVPDVEKWSSLARTNASLAESPNPATTGAEEVVGAAAVDAAADMRKIVAAVAVETLPLPTAVPPLGGPADAKRLFLGSINPANRMGHRWRVRGTHWPSESG